MKKIKLVLVTVVLLSVSYGVYAGNQDRSGEAGASQILINPWTWSAGMAGANTASIVGLEAMSLNIAGMAFTPQTEIMFNHKRWLVGSDININAFGLSQRVSESGVFGVSVMSMSFGEIPVTTVALPEGGLGTYSPGYLNIDVGYAKAFSNSIYGGLSMKIINESLANVTSRGVAFDAGIRYVTGENERIKFGISLKNVGPSMKASGNGLTFINVDPNTGISSTREHRSAPFQLPSLLNIGASYDFYLQSSDSTSDEVNNSHRLTLAGNFTSNSFSKDQIRFGVEYGFKSMFMLRAGYVLESETWFNDNLRTTAYTGPSAGLSFVAPLGKSGSTFGLHYAYEFTDRFSGTHSIGARLNL